MASTETTPAAQDAELRALPPILQMGRVLNEETPPEQLAEHLEVVLPHDAESQMNHEMWLWGHEYCWISSGKSDKRERRYDPR